MSKKPKAPQAADTPPPACSTPKHLYDVKHWRLDVFKMQINAGGDLDIEERGEVMVEFLDGKFAKAIYPFTGQYTRNGWRILASIEAFITQIESELSNNRSSVSGPAPGTE